MGSLRILEDSLRMPCVVLGQSRKASSLVLLYDYGPKVIPSLFSSQTQLSFITRQSSRSRYVADHFIRNALKWVFIFQKTGFSEKEGQFGLNWIVCRPQGAFFDITCLQIWFYLRIVGVLPNYLRWNFNKKPVPSNASSLRIRILALTKVHSSWHETDKFKA